MCTPHNLDDKTSCILDAARDTFLEHGFNAATTDMIQRQAGVSKATLYSRYPSKENLFIAVVENECRLFNDKIEAIRHISGNIREKLYGLGNAYLTLILTPRFLALFRIIIADASRFPQLASQFYQVGPRGIINRVIELLAVAAENQEINIQSVGIENAAILFVGMLRGENQLECLTHPNSSPSAARISAWAIHSVNSFYQAFGTEDPSGSKLSLLQQITQP
jgi:TetR/AcrR family transcriptional repressor of mexJK operon